MKSNWLHSVVLPALAVAALGACGCAARETPRIDRAVLERSQSGVVAVATAHGRDGAQVTLCSGALVAPNLVLTARHCVSESLTTTPACDAYGQSHNGEHVAGDLDPARISVYTGPRVRLDKDVPRAHAVRTLHPSGHVLCDADVAYIVLDRAIDDIPTLPVRLNDGVQPGDAIVPVGFGGGPTHAAGDRHARAAEVLSVGPAANRATRAAVGPREFEVDAPSCGGDSGGPAMDARSGEIVGVVSRGASCTARGNHVYTRVDAFARLSAAAFGAAQKELRHAYAQSATPVRRPAGAHPPRVGF